MESQFHYARGGWVKTWEYYGNIILLYNIITKSQFYLDFVLGKKKYTIESHFRCTFFFSPKKILMKVWFHCTTEVWNFAFLFSIFQRKKCIIKIQNFVKWNHDFIVQQILLQNRITISIYIRLLLYNSKWNHAWFYLISKMGGNGKVIAGWGGKKVV